MNKENITVVIADDHPLILKGLKDELETNGYNVVGHAISGNEALDLILVYQPAVALLDIDMPKMNGFDVIKSSRVKGSKTKFIILSLHKNPYYIARAKFLQIDGYILKDDSFFELNTCIDTVLNGKTYYSKSVDNIPLQLGAEKLKNLNKLSLSETKILKLITKEISNQEIADSLSLSVRTIEKHRSNIIDKLDLKKGNNVLTNWALVNKDIIVSL